MTNRHRHLILPPGLVAMMLAAIAALSACSHHDDSDVPTDACYDFVTLESADDSGTVFSLYKSDDLGRVTYTWERNIVGDTVVENANLRMILQYSRADGGAPYTSGPIEIYGWRMLDNVPQSISFDKFEQDKIKSLQCVKPVTLTRTGPYLNSQIKLYCATPDKPKTLQLQIDAQTTLDHYPTAYIVYEAKSPGLNTYSGYVSWDISPIWDMKWVDGLIIKYMTPDGLKSQTFNKQ